MEIELFPKQDVFVFDDHRFSGYGGGFGNGKTLAGAIKTYNHCQQKNAFFLIGRRHATDLTDSTQRDFLSWFGHLGKFSPKQNSFKFYDEDGEMISEVIFRHLDDLQSLTNMNLSGFWIDQAEEVTETAFNFLVGRLRRPVQRREGFITFNMEGHNWIWRRFLKKEDERGDILQNAQDYFLVTASTLENKDNLPDDYVTSLMAMPADYVKRFVYGDWDNFAGQIFDEFKPRIHVIPPFEIPTYWEKIRAIDHGQDHPTGCLWAAVDYDGNMYIYREYKKSGDIISNHAKAINEMSVVQTPKGPQPDKYNYTLIDPSCYNKTGFSKDGHQFSVADEYLDHGITTLPAQNDVIASINRVKEYFKIDPAHYHPFLKGEDDMLIKGAPRLYIFNTCPQLVDEVQQYKWKQALGKGTLDPYKDTIQERPVKRNDDLVDPLRYLIMSRPQNPQMISAIEPWVWNNPLELARRAQAMDMTVDDLIHQRFNRTSIRHSDSKINHRSSLH